jgi:hypothetical protein
VKPPTANPKGIAIDLIEHGATKHLHDPKHLQMGSVGPPEVGG